MHYGNSAKQKGKVEAMKPIRPFIENGGNSKDTREHSAIFILIADRNSRIKMLIGLFHLWREHTSIHPKLSALIVESISYQPIVRVTKWRSSLASDLKLNRYL